jgi:quinone-modifying oxidoreductase subunit QmoC
MMASSVATAPPAPHWTARVQYEAELDPGFPDRVAGMPGGEKIFSCIQCGTCTGSCPVSPYMDLSPRRIIAMTRAGFKREVLGSFTIWLCSSCYSCTVACPKQIQITDVMYALKRQAIQEGRHPRRFAVPMLAREFFRSVRDRGRNSEGRLILSLYSRVNPMLLLQNMALGFRLWRRGRISLKAESVGRRSEVRTLVTRRAGRAAEKEVAA